MSTIPTQVGLVRCLSHLFYFSFSELKVCLLLPRAVCPPSNSQNWRCWHLGGLLKALGAPHTPQRSAAPRGIPLPTTATCVLAASSHSRAWAPPAAREQQPYVGISRRCVIPLVSDIHLLTGSLSNCFWISSLSSYETVLEQDASIHPSTFRNKSGKYTALLLPRGSLFSIDYDWRGIILIISSPLT